jgi:ATP-binding cassette subfamily B protein
MSARFKTLHGFLYEYSSFGRLPVPALHRMIEKLQPVAFSKGELILREGDPPGPLYVVEQGHVRVFTLADGKPRNLAFYREGDFFGELSILNGSPPWA